LTGKRSETPAADDASEQLLDACSDEVIRFKGHGCYRRGRSHRVACRRTPRHTPDRFCGVYNRAVAALRRKQVQQSAKQSHLAEPDNVEVEACLSENALRSRHTAVDVTDARKTSGIACCSRTTLSNSWNTELTGQGSISTAALPWKRPDTSITRKSSSCYLRNEPGAHTSLRQAQSDNARAM
jgi:hypothetical protein